MIYNFLQALQRAVTAFRTPIVTESASGEGLVSMPLTEAEAGVVFDYRRWLVVQEMHQAQTEAAHEQKLAGGGCGGCPSQGGCSEAEPEVGDAGL